MVVATRRAAVRSLATVEAERISDALVYHGEGPCWWPATGALRYVDMLAGDVMSWHPDGRVTRAAVGSPVAAVIRPRAGGGAVVARERDIAVYADDELTELELTVPVHDDPGLRCNEGNCDPDGRFYVGTMAYARTPGAAALHVWSAGARRAEPVLPGLTIANGLGWSPDGTTAYFIDTPTGIVRAFSYDASNGLSTPRPLVTVPESQGHPDGLCVDAEGGIWVALNGGGAVHRYDPDGARTATVEVGTRQATACTFGGADLSTLFITTSREGMAQGEDPTAGSLYAVSPGVRGLPPLEFGG